MCPDARFLPRSAVPRFGVPRSAVPGGALPCLALLLLLLVPLGGEATADEGAWSRHPIGEGASIALPAQWPVRLSADRLRASSPLGDVRLLARVGAPRAGEDLQAFADRDLREVRGATIRRDGFTIEDALTEGLGGTPARWTLVTRAKASPPARSLYVHLLAEGRGYVLQVDVSLGTFDGQRSFVRGLLATFEAAAPTRSDPALLRALAALAEHPPQTAEDYRAWLDELQMLGDDARPHLVALARAYVEGPGSEDEAVRRLLGDRKYEVAVPEEISFRGFPFLRLIDRANEKRWFTPSEETAWRLAQSAAAHVEGHRTRLADASYHAAVSAFANLAHDPRLRDRHLVFHHAKPYVLCLVAGTPTSRFDAPLAPDGPAQERRLAQLQEREGDLARALQRRAADYSALYAALLEQLGAEHGLHDLAAPWGGGTDVAAHRSFQDGVPLVVLVFEDAKQREIYRGAGHSLPPGLSGADALDLRTGTLRTTLERREPRPAPSAFAEVDGAAQLLWWFSRQKGRWRAPPMGGSVAARALAQVLGAGVREEDGRVRITGRNAPTLAGMQGLASALEKRGQAYPVVPPAKLWRSGSRGEGIRFIQAELALPGNVAWMLLEQQNWAFLLFLREFEEGRYAAAFDAVLEALLRREIGRGRAAADVLAKALGSSEDDGWESIEAQFRTWVWETLLEKDVESWALASPAVESPQDSARAPAEAPPPPGKPDARLGLAPDGLAVLHLRRRLRSGPYFEAARFDLTETSGRAELAAFLGQVVRWRGGDATEVALEVEAGRDVGWDVVQHVLRAAAAPGVQIQRIRVKIQDPPPDQPPPSDEARPEPLGVIFTRMANSRTDVEIADQHLSLPSEGRAVLAALTAARNAWSGALLMLGTEHDGIPWSDVEVVLDALERAAFTHVALDVRTTPR